MAEDFSADLAIVEKPGKATAYMEDYLFQLGRSIGLDKIPATATSKGDAGTLLASSTHIYVCISKDVWKRVAISTF